MKTLQLCSSDISGGAARAAYRLHTGLRKAGIDSYMLVQDKKSDDPYVIGPKTNCQKGIAIVRKGLASLPLSMHRNRKKVPWSYSWFPSNLYKIINDINPDIVNLHWINNGFMNLSNIPKINAPIVWRLPDMWAFTGGCHYAGDCKKYTEGCGNCPQLGSKRKRDLSYKGFKKKQKIYSKVDLNIVVLCKWMERCVKESILLSDANIARIPNGLDTDMFRPIEKDIARDILNLPKDRKIVLFGAMNSTSNKRKGFKYLKEALEYLSNKEKDLLLVVFGSSRDKDIENLPFETKFLGRLGDDQTLALAYSSANVFVAPSKEENLANTILESFACGIPCVSFDIGGFPDMIEHKTNGYLAKHFDIKDLANGIQYCINKDSLGVKGREKVMKEYSLEVQAKRYVEFYEGLVTD
jgi:glycosyltransferase involved in cell wall biosynthesis